MGPKPQPTSEQAPAKLDAGQVQDLADRIPELLGSVGAAELRFGVSVSAVGELPDGAREKVDEILADVAEDLKLGD
ncbi:MAG: hypothetical protein F4123_11310 [Gemmatimonadetes bacterium]|nr:hypothetical protein [Gemmatimonadota bacterium]MYA64116.1 hypothetical protein [Gemmatimonadota bacterium]MYB97272.1 hypothetical protein [Gemmatimonadota bacterium]MYI46946.1 hypothetical protein [Gemmatimonadota bacterium]MYK67102.1 hypothetical protein [Gemmatimonadota bacterium]